MAQVGTVALFLDLACPHCKAEYEFWRAYQGTLAERNRSVYRVVTDPWGLG